MRERDENKRLDSLRDVAKNAPSAVHFWQLAEQEKDHGNLEEAESAFRKAIELDPSLPGPYCNLSIILMDYGRYDAAEKLLRASLSIKGASDLEVSHCLLGIVLKNLEDFEGALTHYRAAIELDPKYDEAHYNLGVLLSESDLQGAVAAFSNAIEIDPEYAMAYRELGRVTSKLGDQTKAEFYLRKSIELDKDDALAHIHFGLVLWKMSAKDDARTHFEKAHSLVPESPDPLLCLGKLAAHEGQWESATWHFEEATKLDPDSPIVRLAYAKALRKKGDLKAAVAQLQTALALDPELQEAQELLEQLGDIDAGYLSLEQ